MNNEKWGYSNSTRYEPFNMHVLYYVIMQYTVKKTGIGDVDYTFFSELCCFKTPYCGLSNLF